MNRTAIATLVAVVVTTVAQAGSPSTSPGSSAGVTAGAGAGAGAVAGAVAGAAQKARVVRTTDLRAQPSSDSALLEVVAAQTEVAVLERQGGWYRVALLSRDGWMRLTAVRFASATPAASGGLTASLGFLKSGRSAVQTGTVTTGVRGLSETDLANSVPDPEAVDALDGLAVSGDDAAHHARELGLKAKEIPFIKAPAKDDEGGKDSRKNKGKKPKDDDEEEGG